MPNYTPGPETATRFFTCTAQMSDASTCGKPSVDDVGFPICEYHVLRAYRWVTFHLENLAADKLFQLTYGIERIDAERAAQDEKMIDREHVVYYVQIGEHIKIGYTSRLKARMKTYPITRRLLAVEAGGLSIEKQRHNQFKQYLDQGNEWFKPGPELLVHINTLRLGSGSTPIKIPPGQL